MSGKKILATTFAVVILFKMLALLTNPGRWMGFAGMLLGHPAIVTGIYLVLIAVTGYYVFTNLDLIDIGVVMFFTSLLMGLSLIPYSGELLKLRVDIMAVSLGKSWLAMVIWGALAVAVLYRVFSHKKG
jgi:hypothetical protein